MTTKRLRARGLTTADIAAQKYTNYHEIVEENVEFHELFDPSFYEHHKRVKPYDVLRLTHPAGLFDVYVTVRSVIPGGVTVDYHGGRPPKGFDPYKVAEDELGAALQIKVCPIDRDGRPVVKVEHTPKTRWRVIGLNSTEVTRDIATKLEAEIAMAHYLNDIRMRLPTPEELMAEIKLREALSKPAEPTKPEASKPGEKAA
jgi:hypothetical protein